MKKDTKIKDMNEYQKSKKNKNKKKNKKKKKIKKTFKIIMAILILGIIIINICGNVRLSKLKYEIGSLKKELRQKDIVLEELESKVSTNTSTQNIEKKAKEELDMDYPKENQIRYIKVGK